MPLQIFNFITQAFAYAEAYFVMIVESCGLTGVYIAAVFVFLLFKFLFRPIFGSAGSDQVKKRNKGGNSNG